jgi:hypothetical protein
MDVPSLADHMTTDCEGNAANGDRCKCKDPKNCLPIRFGAAVILFVIDESV